MSAFDDVRTEKAIEGYTQHVISEDLGEVNRLPGNCSIHFKNPTYF